MSAELTDREFWRNYWETTPIPIAGAHPFFEELLGDRFPGPGARLVDVGGFPGAHCVYFQKVRAYETTILDFYVDRDIVAKVEEKNGVPAGSLRVIEADFLNFDGKGEFDVVFSAGFIEHFDDTKDVLRRHVELLRSGGTLLVTLPNFRGLNGWLQYWVDRRNYRAHNIRSMDIRYLKLITAELGLENASVFYFGQSRLWLDSPGTLPRWAVKLIYSVSKVMRRLPRLPWKLTAPFIAVVGEKGRTESAPLPS
ncbi:MAG: class I SAM-dependent methyltransferase [bacterium]|nr:class I SAM-dependent methyltransferase [bacterium]